MTQEAMVLVPRGRWWLAQPVRYARRARKPYTCDACGRDIYQGDFYVRIERRHHHSFSQARPAWTQREIYCPRCGEVIEPDHPSGFDRRACAWDRAPARAGGRADG